MSAKQKWNVYVARMFPMRQAWEERNFGRLEQLLEESTPAEGEPDFRGWEWYYFQDQVNAALTKLTLPDGVTGPVAWSPTGNEFATRSDTHVDLWDADMLQRTRRIDVGFPFHSLEWSPSGEKIAVGGKKGELGILSPSDGTIVSSQQLFRGSGIESKVQSVSWSSAGTEVAAASGRGQIVVISLPGGEVDVIHEAGENHYCLSLDWHPTRRVLVAGRNEGDRSAFDFSRQSISTTRYKRGSSWCYSVAWNPSGTKVATVEGGLIRILDDQMQSIRILDGHGGRAAQAKVSQLVWQSDSVLVSCGQDHTIKTWDVDEGVCIRTFRLHARPVVEIALSPTGTSLLSYAEDDRTVAHSRLIGTDRETAFSMNLPNAGASVRKNGSPLKWSDSGTHLASFALGPYSNPWNGVLGIWSIGRRKPVQHRRESGPGEVAWEGRQLRLHSRFRGTFDRFDPLVEDALTSVQLHKPFDPNPPVEVSRCNNDFTTIAKYTWGSQSLEVAELWPMKRRAANRLQTSIRSLRWNRANTRFVMSLHGSLAVCSSDGQILRESANSSISQAIDWHPTDQLIAFGPRDGRIIIRDAAALIDRAVLNGHRGDVWDVHWSPDGRRIASAGTDGTVRIWDAATGHELLPLTVTGVDGFLAVEWSPDGLQLAANTTDGQLIIWGSESIEASGRNATSLETGVISTALRQCCGGQNPPPPGVPRLHWKEYFAKLQRILAISEDGNGELSDRIEAEFSALRDSARARPDAGQSYRDFIQAASLLVEADPKSNGARWLGQEVIGLLRAEIITSPDPLGAWRDLTHFQWLRATADNAGTDQWNDVLDSLSQVIAHDPDDVVALHQRAWIYQEQLDDSKSAAADRVAALKSRFQSADNVSVESYPGFWRMAAEIRKTSGDREGAFADLNNMLKAVFAGKSEEQMSHEAHAAIADTINSRFNSEEAVRQYSTLIEKYPACEMFYVYRGAAIVSHHRHSDKALSELHRAVSDFQRGLELAERVEDVTGIVLDASQELRSRRQPKAALQVARVALAHAPDDFYVHRELLDTYMDLHEYEQALTHIDKAISLYLGLGFLHKRRAMAMFRLGRYDEALASLKTARELSPEDTSTLTWISPDEMARCADESFRNGVIELATEAMLDPHAFEVAHRVLVAFGRDDDALPHYRELAKDNPEASGDFWRDYGAHAFEAGEYAESINAFREAVERSPETCNNLFWINLHQLASCPEDFRQEYAELADRVVQLSANEYSALGVRGLVATALGDDLQADEDFEKAVEGGARLSRSIRLESPQDQQTSNWHQCFELAYMLGYSSSVLEQREDWERAIRRRRQAIAIGTPLVEADPEDPVHFSRLSSHLTTLAALERQTGETTAALSTMKRLVAMQHGRLQTAAGQFDEKHFVRSLQELLSLALEVHDETVIAETIVRLQEFVAKDVAYANDSAWFAIRYPVVDSEITEQAVAWAEAAVEDDPDNTSFYNTLGVAYYRAGRFEESIEALKKSEELSTGDPSGYNAFFLAMAHWQIGDTDEARQWYDKAVAWMQEQPSENTELRRFQEEAEELLKEPTSKPETQAPPTDN